MAFNCEELAKTPAATQVGALYTKLIDDVVEELRRPLLEDGTDERVLDDLKKRWLTKLLERRCLAPPKGFSQLDGVDADCLHEECAGGNAVAAPLHQLRQQRLQTRGQCQGPPASHGGKALDRGALAVPVQQMRHRSRAGDESQWLPQLDGADDSDDDDDDLVSEDELDDATPSNTAAAGSAQNGAAPAAAAAAAAPQPEVLSDSDDSDDSDVFETDNIMICQWVSRTRNRKKVTLKEGIVHVNGLDIVFQKAMGEVTDW